MLLESENAMAFMLAGFRGFYVSPNYNNPVIQGEACRDPGPRGEMLSISNARVAETVTPGSRLALRCAPLGRDDKFVRV